MGILMYGKIMTLPMHALVVRRTKKGCRQRWMLRMLRLTGSRDAFIQ